MPRLQDALERFDALNAADPTLAPGPDGRLHPAALLYGRRMSERLVRMEPDASEALQLAVERLTLAGFIDPEGRDGYRRWRRDLARMHAELAADVLREVGYEPALAARVQDLIQKRRLASDPEARTLEDVACLVFLEHALGEFAERHPHEKLVAILRKTWVKMSPRGQRAALDVPQSGRAAAALREALADAAE